MFLKNRKVVRTVQIIFGLILVLFGLNIFFQFMPGPQFNEAGTAYLGALFSTGFIFPVMGIVFLASGIMYVVGKFSAFASVLLFPFSINIMLFHLIIDVTGILVGFTIFVLNVYFILIDLEKFKPLFSK